MLTPTPFWYTSKCIWKNWVDALAFMREQWNNPPRQANMVLQPNHMTGLSRPAWLDTVTYSPKLSSQRITDVWHSLHLLTMTTPSYYEIKSELASAFLFLHIHSWRSSNANPGSLLRHFIIWYQVSFRVVILVEHYCALNGIPKVFCTCKDTRVSPSL